MIATPPEWAPQTAILLAWPHDRSHWGQAFVAVEQTFVSLTAHISATQKLIILCLNQKQQARICELLMPTQSYLDNISFYFIPTNDIWTRDYGPISILKNGKPSLLDFTFNGWGKKFLAEKDNQVNQQLQQSNAFAQTFLEEIELVLEGGALEFDGNGALLTTTSCLLTTTRNPDHSITTLTERLKSLFGVTQVLWLEHGFLTGDDTDGHIDMLARFVNAKTICFTACQDKQDEHYETLHAMATQLATFKNTNGKPYQLIPLPWPQPQFYHGKRLPLSYANFVITNKAILAPLYADPADEQALTILHNCFPGRKIIGINAQTLVRQGGSLHCASKHF